MEVKAKAKYIKASPRKVRLVIDVVRGLGVDEALNQLKFMNKRAAGFVTKLLKSAIANAENNFELKKDNLFIKTITASEGPTLRRWMPRARGRATPLRKRTTHLDLVLGELVDSGKVEGKKQKLDEPVKLGKEPKENKGVKTPDAPKDKKKEEPGAKENIVDPRLEGRGKNTRIEGGAAKKGFGSKFFRRKSG